MFKEKPPIHCSSTSSSSSQTLTRVVDVEDEIGKKFQQLFEIIWVDKHSSRILFEIDFDVCAANTTPTLHYYLEQNTIIKSLPLLQKLPQRPLRILFTSSLDYDASDLHAQCQSGNLLMLKSDTTLPVEIHVADNGNYFNELWNEQIIGSYQIPSLQQGEFIAVDTDMLGENYDIIIVNVEKFLTNDRPERLKKLTKSLTENQIFIAVTTHSTYAYPFVKTLKNLFFHLGGFDFQPLKSLKAKWWLFCKHNGYHFAEIVKWGCLQYLQLNTRDI